MSGDKHLLEMHRYQDIDILEPADFLRAQAQRIDLNEAIGAADRGEFASDEEVGDFFGKHGG